jgi:hypothetical protein
MGKSLLKSRSYSPHNYKTKRTENGGQTSMLEAGLEITIPGFALLKSIAVITKDGIGMWPNELSSFCNKNCHKLQEIADIIISIRFTCVASLFWFAKPFQFPRMSLFPKRLPSPGIRAFFSFL